MRSLLASFVILAAVIAISLPSCKHDPMFTIPDPQDTVTIDTGANAGVPCSPDTAYFQNQVLPLLISQCAQAGCHDAATRAEGIELTSYQKVMTTGKVKAFNPNDSKIYKAILETDPDDRMPRPPAAPLTAEQKDLIRKWIQQGAQNNVCNENYGSCDTTNVTYANFVSGLLANKCVGCHSGANPQGGIKLTTYTEVKAAAQNGTLYGSVARLTGYSAMPKGGAALSPCFVNKIKAWIDAGTPQ